MKHTPDHSASNLPARLAAPARRALASIGVTRLEQLPTLTESDLQKLHGMGPNGIKLLREALAHHGLAFTPEA